MYSNLFVLLIYFIWVKFCLEGLLAFKKGWPSDVFHLFLPSSAPFLGSESHEGKWAEVLPSKLRDNEVLPYTLPCPPQGSGECCCW